MATGQLRDAILAYGIPIDPRDVEAALGDAQHGPAFAEWAKTRLTSDTLLTAEELAVYDTLEANGTAERLAASFESRPYGTLGDGDIQQAIEDLDRCTESINKQAELLKQQQNALARLVETADKATKAREDVSLQEAYRWDSKRKQLAAKVDGLSQSLAFAISDIEERGGTAALEAAKTTESVLQSDDKLLRSLEKLGLELRASDSEEQSDVSSLRQLCARLIKYTVEAMRTRLDRTYLETISAAAGSGTEDHAGEDDVAALQEELESLYSEILPVAQMTAEQQYLEPALQAVAGRNAKDSVQSAEATRYINECLDFLLERGRLVSARVDAFQTHQAAAVAIVATGKSELDVQLAPPKEPRPPAVNVSPTRRRKSSGPTSGSPVRARTTPGGRRRSSGAYADLPPLDQILQNLTLLLPQGDSGCSGEDRVNVVSRALTDRSNKAHEVARNVQETFETSAASQLSEARRATRLARDSVLAESPFAEVNLVDPEIHESIAVLAQEVAKIKGRVGESEKATNKAKTRNAKRDELVSRWAR